jgi:dolichol kinase
MDETSRQLVHLFFGLAIAAAIALIDRPAMLSIMVTALFLGVLLSDALSRGYHIEGVSPLVELLERQDVLPGKGAILFLLSSLLCLFFFDAGVVVPAVLALAVLDGVATLIGIRYGTHRIYNGKSVEGTGAGIAAAALVLVLLISPAQALAAAVLAGVIELVAPVDDNLLIPPCICLLLTYLA